MSPAPRPGPSTGAAAIASRNGAVPHLRKALSVKEKLIESARRLHSYLVKEHWDGKALRGPTPGVRWNLRLWRFVKAYAPFIEWHDDCVSYQGQGYWIVGNWLLHRLTKEDEYGEIALASSRFVIESQRDNGSWPNPIPERKHLVTNIEGLWASAGLLATHNRAGDQSCLEGAQAWYKFMEEHIGYQRHGENALAVNYFDVPRGKVPNNSTAAVWFLSELAEATGARGPLEKTEPLLSFLADVQGESGEMPYEVPGEGYTRSIPHYQCFQYNAFQLADLYHFWKRTGADAAAQIASGLASFLAGGVTPDGACRHSCSADHPKVIYHAHTLAYALSCASRWGLGDYTELSRRAYEWTLAQQRPDGSFPFSYGDYRVLRDTRPYPANLAMAVFHLASEAGEEP
jgi:hypothetical protein